MTRSIALVCAAVLLGGAGAGADLKANFKVVAHPTVPVSALNRSAVSLAFLKKMDKWSDGTAVVPVEQAQDSSIRATFCRAVHDRSVSMIEAFWQKQVFSGRGTPPVAKATDAEVIAYVRSVPGAIGYVSAAADTAGVKEIRIE